MAGQLDLNQNHKDYTIKLYAGLRASAGKKSVSISAPEVTIINNVLKLLADNYPNLKPVVSPENTNNSRSILILINGRDIRRLSGLDTMVSPQDIIELFPPVSGG